MNDTQRDDSQPRGASAKPDTGALEHYCGKWGLEKPALLAKTLTSDVYKVKLGGEDAALKILSEAGRKFESKGAAVLRCFGGNGATRLLNADEGAHLLEYISGSPLKTLVEQGNDDAATETLCELIAKLHSYTGPCPTELISMERNFRSLFERAGGPGEGPLYEKGAKLARELIASANDLRVLHGDLHHENVLQHPQRGWLAIDPQCLFGERTYDLANAFYNPSGFAGLLSAPERIARMAETFSRRLQIERSRILQYAFAYGCLSASWHTEDGQSPGETLRIAEAVERQL